MNIDRLKEALRLLQGTLNYDCVAEAKKIIGQIVDGTERSGDIGNEDGKSCLFAGPGRGDCGHAVGLPGKVDYEGYENDQYGRPNGWCEVCWRAQQIAWLRYYLNESWQQYGGTEYAANNMDLLKNKMEKELYDGPHV